MFKKTIAIRPMNKGQMVVTFKGSDKRKPNKPKTLPIMFGKRKETYTWSEEMVVECVSRNGNLVEWLTTFFKEFGIRGVDMSDFVIEDNKTYYEGICWGETKNVHFWFEVEELS
jgi:hypothetical protein